MTARDRTPIVHAPGVLRIPLTQGMFALIDEVDAPLVAQYKWYALRAKHTFYACRTIAGPPKMTFYMHRVLLDVWCGEEVDHIDRRGLNNCRANIRLVSRSVNVHNTAIRCDNSSGFRGVSWSKQKQAWRARIHVDQRERHIGFFATAEEASVAFDRAVLATRDEHATTNHARSPASRD